MRLLNALTGELRWFNRSGIPPHAILSHVWDQREQSFQDVSLLHPLSVVSSAEYIPGRLVAGDGHSRPQVQPFGFPRLNPTLSPKIRGCCKLAADLGYTWVWLDICCIDKSSSSELSEAINSMYTWYSKADICIAYLPDVPDDAGDPRADESAFRHSRWFQRGWTLQELIAPCIVLFVSRGWKQIGTKVTLARTIEEITCVHTAILTFRQRLSEVSVAERMRWASERETTRIEDKAYSLQGIFGVSMPILYGEGNAAFRRLQEEIMKLSPDQTLFAWGIGPGTWTRMPTMASLLADSAYWFRSPEPHAYESIPPEEIPMAAAAFVAAITGTTFHRVSVHVCITSSHSALFCKIG